MKWQSFENKIREKLSAHRTEIDMDALWDAIEPDVDAINARQRKKRRAAAWLWFFGLLLLGSGAGFYFFNLSGTENLNKNGNENKIENIADDQIIANNENDKELIITAETTGKNDVQKPLPIISNKNKKDNIRVGSSQVAAGFTEKIIPEKTISENNKKSNFSGDIDPIANSKNDNNKIENNLAVRPTELIQRLETAPLTFLIYKKNTAAYFIKQAPVAVKNPVGLNLPEEKKHPMSKKAFRFSAGLNAGAGYANRSLEVLDSVGKEYLDIRETTEKSLETITLGLRLNARHRSGLEITSGLQFTRITELFEIQNKVVNTDSVPGIKFYAVNPNNDTIPVFGMVPRTTTVETHKKYYNRYTMFDIPVLAGYFVENGNWSLGAQAGIFANISLKTSGRFLINENEDVDIEPLFRPGIGLSYYLGFSAGYKLSDNLEINIAPYLRHYTQNFAQPSFPLSQKYTLYGINAGIRYWF